MAHQIDRILLSSESLDVELLRTSREPLSCTRCKLQSHVLTSFAMPQRIEYGPGCFGYANHVSSHTQNYYWVGWCFFLDLLFIKRIDCGIIWDSVNKTEAKQNDCTVGVSEQSNVLVRFLTRRIDDGYLIQTIRILTLAFDSDCKVLFFKMTCRFVHHYELFIRLK